MGRSSARSELCLYKVSAESDFRLGVLLLTAIYPPPQKYKMEDDLEAQLVQQLAEKEWREREARLKAEHEPKEKAMREARERAEREAQC